MLFVKQYFSGGSGSGVGCVAAEHQRYFGYALLGRQFYDSSVLKKCY